VVVVAFHEVGGEGSIPQAPLSELGHVRAPGVHPLASAEPPPPLAARPAGYRLRCRAGRVCWTPMARWHWRILVAAATAALLLAARPPGRPGGPPAPGRPRLDPGAPALAADETLGPAGIHLRGGGEPGRRAAAGALERVLATPTGARARELLAEGRLAGPLTIELNASGDNLTRYRVPGEELGDTIEYDPGAAPLVETERGREPASPETILAHELGHALFKLRSEAEVIREVENPVRVSLGLPRRTRF
jgi:hypothetical protein